MLVLVFVLALALALAIAIALALALAIAIALKPITPANLSNLSTFAQLTGFFTAKLAESSNFRPPITVLAGVSTAIPPPATEQRKVTVVFPATPPAGPYYTKKDLEVNHRQVYLVTCESPRGLIPIPAQTLAQSLMTTTHRHERDDGILL